jgi:fatty acid desaturase
MANASKHLENPLPHLQEARKSASRIVELQKKLLSHRAELAAFRQMKKIALAITGAVFAVMALLFGFGWASVALNQAGWSAGALAVISFIFFSLIAGIFVYLFLRSLELPEDHHS